MPNYFRLRPLLRFAGLIAAVSLGGCAAYPDYPTYGYNTGYAYPGPYAYSPGPYYGGAVIGFGGGWHHDWHHDWHHGRDHDFHPGGWHGAWGHGPQPGFAGHGGFAGHPGFAGHHGFGPRG